RLVRSFGGRRERLDPRSAPSLVASSAAFLERVAGAERAAELSRRTSSMALPRWRKAHRAQGSGASHLVPLQAAPAPSAIAGSENPAPCIPSAVSGPRNTQRAVPT